MYHEFKIHITLGENPDDIRPKVKKMMNYGVKSIFDYSAEEDLEAEKLFKNTDKNDLNQVSELIGRKIYDLNERNSDKNAKIFINCIDAVAGLFRYFLKNSNEY
jgi:hypothetical protein